MNDPLAAAIGTPTPAAPDGTGTPTPTSQESWQEQFLPEEMRANNDLAGFATVADMAKNLVDTQTFARSRIALPKEGDDNSFSEFISKIRPETADAYKIEVPDGQPATNADGMRPIFHEAGLHPRQAEIINKGWNQFQADQSSLLAQQATDELTALEVEMGPSAYNQRTGAVANMLTAMGLEVPDVAIAMQTLGGGSRKAMEALFTLATKTGELANVNGDDVNMQMGVMTAEQAQQKVNAMIADKDMIKKIEVAGSPERKRYDELNKVIASKNS